MIRAFTFIILVSLFACKDAADSKLKTVKYKRAFLLQSSIKGFGEEKVNYLHYISIDNFSEDFFGRTNFSKAVGNYLDTCAFHSDDFESIYFLKSTGGCGFETNELNDENINENAIAAFQVRDKKIIGVYIFDGPNKKLFLLKGDELTQTF